MQNEFVVEVKNLSVKYPNRLHLAVEDVSFEVNKGTITTVIGPNGSGKTTVIKAILGFLHYTGEIRVFGKPVYEVYDQIGFVPQRFGFDEDFPINVTEFVMMPLRVNTCKTDCIKQVKAKLNQVGCGELNNRLMKELSGGQLQRVLLARALVSNPKLLFLDEPEAGVDVAGEQSLYDLLEVLVKKEKLSVLVASHELDVVYTYADTVVCINRKLVCTGKPIQVLNQKMFEALYGRQLKFYGHKHHTRHH